MCVCVCAEVGAPVYVIVDAPVHVVHEASIRADVEFDFRHKLIAVAWDECAFMQ